MRALVVTSISAPNAALRALAEGCGRERMPFVLIGDTKSPADMTLEGCEFYSMERQRGSGLRYAELCPERSYARKNIGYLLAVRAGADVLVETDDDNLPETGFWSARQRIVNGRVLAGGGWVNAYSYFSDAGLWPRGLPLTEVRKAARGYDDLPVADSDCPIQQGLADGNPDVDAIYRLVFPLPQNFRRDRRVSLGAGAWCPFNSQNTTWWADAFALLYLPAYCSFRMTDIWRSFVAQRIAWANGWSVLFHEPTVWQDRNEHSLMRDFEDEIPGYLLNLRIAERLEGLSLAAGAGQLGENLMRCYEALIEMGAVGGGELDLLGVWLSDLAGARRVAELGADLGEVASHAAAG